MVYLPLLLNVSFFVNDLIMVDECQDLNPARYHLIRRMSRGKFCDGQVVFDHEDQCRHLCVTGVAAIVRRQGRVGQATHVPASIAPKAVRARASSAVVKGLASTGRSVRVSMPGA